jgi:hypothetical protein
VGPPNSVQLIFQTGHLSPTINETSDYFEVDFFSWFKTFAIVEDKLVVLR